MNSSYNSISEDLRNKFKNIVGKENFLIEKEHRWAYALGASIIESEWIPDIILLPKNTNQVSEILKLANENKIPVTPRGSGTSLSAGTMTPYGGIILDLCSMNKILSIDIENFMVELEPGVICDDLNEKLKPFGFFFPPDPGSSSVATLGGMVANNGGGIQAFKYGVTKNYVLYVETVFPDGKILKLGTDVLKSVSSYNLKDLIIGSEGTLAVITKIGLKIRPLPKHRKLGFFIFDDIEKLANSVLELRRNGIVPNMLEFMDKVFTKAVFDYMGGNFSNYPLGYLLIAEMDGRSELAVDEEFTELFNIIKSHKPIFSKKAANMVERAEFIAARKAVLPAITRLAPSFMAEDCTIKITNFVEAIKKIEEIPQKLNIPNIIVAVVCHMEGNLHPTFVFNENDEKDRKDFERAFEYLYREIIIPLGGTITGEHGIGKLKTRFLELEHGTEVVDLMHKIKNLIDPNMILNPGSGKGDKRPIPISNVLRGLKNQPGKILYMNCNRCGLCTVTCPSHLNYKSEAFSPRGRLSLLNGLVHGEINLEDSKLINEIMHSCTLCGLCAIKCPSGVDTYRIFEKAREIMHHSHN